MLVPTEEKQQEMSQEQLLKLIERTCQNVINGKEDVSEAEMPNKFKGLPGEDTREYEKAIAGFADKWSKDTINVITETMLKKAESPNCTMEEKKNIFHAFAVAVNYHRLHKNFDTEGDLIRNYRDVFQTGHIFFKHLDLLYRLDSILEADEDALKEILSLAKENSTNLKCNCGGHHAYAEAIAIIYENDTLSCYPYLIESRAKLMKDAVRAINEAKKLDSKYAKFYCTEGRLLALEGKIDEAIKKVSQAISMEDDGRKDYAIRISQYTGFLQQFRSKQNTHTQMSALENSLDTHKKNMDAQKDDIIKAMEEQEKQSMVKNMEFLGLFSGIVSFTIGSLSIGSAFADKSFQGAAGLIIVLMGALIGVFGAFGIVLHGFLKKESIRNLIVFILGILVVFLGIWLCLVPREALWFV